MTPQELRNSILQRAIEGKLVEQRSEEGTGEELYKLIQEEKKKLTKEGKIKKQKALDEIKEEEIPFDIPKNWKWVRLGEVISFKIGKTPPRSEIHWWKHQIPWVSIADMKENGFIKETKEGISTEALEQKFSNSISPKGTLLMSFKLTVGRVSLLNIEAVHNEAIISIYPIIDREDIFKLYLFKILPLVSQSGDTKNAIKGKTLNSVSINNLLIPLPPLAEQKRIVDKIEELMPLLDEYEKNWQRLNDLNKKFPEDMKKSLLQEAIKGNLVEQRAEEGHTSNIIKELLNEKQKLLEDGKIYKKKPTAPFFEGDYPFDIPETWSWVQLSDVSVIQEGAGIRKYQYKNGGVQLLCVTNILENNIDLAKKQLFVSEEEYIEKYQHLTPMKGDIVTACSGGSWGKVAIYDLDDTVMLNTSTLRMRFFGDLSNNKYLYYVTQSAFFKEQLKRQLVGIQPNFGYAHYSRIELPLPPLAEQKRIVEKLEELLPLCDELINKEK